MKLLYYSSYFSPYTSGLVRYPLPFLKHISRQHSVTVLTFAHQKDLPAREKQGSLNIIRMPYWLRLSKGFLSPSSIKTFNHELDQVDGLIVTLPNVEATPLIYLAKRKCIPILIMHVCDLDLGSGLTNQLLNFGVNLAASKQMQQANHLTTITLDYAKTRPWYKLYHTKLSPLAPAIMFPQIDPVFDQEIKKIKTTTWIGFVGRMAREKGIEILVEALSYLPFPYEVVLVGPHLSDVIGEHAYSSRIVSQLRSKAIPHRFFGFINQDQLNALYRNLDVLALPSNNHTEAFGLVQVEAMFAGTPVVASSLPGVRVPIKLTGMGLLVPPNNPQALANALKKVITDKRYYTSLKHIDKAKNIFSPHKTLTAYDQLIKQTFAS